MNRVKAKYKGKVIVYTKSVIGWTSSVDGIPTIKVARPFLMVERLTKQAIDKQQASVL